MKRLFLAATLCAAAAFSVQAQTWTGNVNNDWNNAGNWINPGSVPGPSSNVIIPDKVGSGRWPVLSGNVIVNTLSTYFGSQLDVNGFALTLNTVDANNNLQGLIVNNSLPANDIVITIAGGTGGYSTTFLRNTFNGNLVLNLHGYFYEGNAGAPDNSSASTYNGNTTINMNAAAAMGISNTNYSTFNGNLTVNRNARVTLDMFGAGGIVHGNFIFNDTGGGNTILGNQFYRNIQISGTVNISANYPEHNDFSLHRFANQTSGGSINIQHAGVINITRDTLKVNSLVLSDFSGNFVYFINNLIQGDVGLYDHPSNSYPTYIRANSIFGNSIFSNNGSGTFHEADQPGNANIYNGNTSFTASGSGTLNIGAVSKSSFNGHLSITREAAGITNAFGGGADIAGDFLYINNTGGATTLGNKNIGSTHIAGKIDIIAQYAGNGNFNMYRLVNHDPNGNIVVTNTTGFDLYRDTLIVGQLSLVNYRGANAYFEGNRLTGNLEIGDDFSNGSYYTYLRNNHITGNSSISCNGGGTFMDADNIGFKNRYEGNVTYNKGNTGAISVGSGDTTIISGNLTLNSSSGIVLYKVKFTGASNSTFEQYGNQVTEWGELIMQKSSAQYSLILEDSVQMVTKCTFMTGQIVSATGKEMIFRKSASHQGVSDQSHVVGPVVKLGNQAFTFPVGSATHLQAVKMTAPATNLDRYRCEYKATGPHPTYDTSLHASSIKAMSSCEYWDFRQEAGSSSLRLSFEFGAPCGHVWSAADLRVARWTGSQWEAVGSGGYNYAVDSGYTENTNSLSAYGIFTLASASVVTPSVTIVQGQSNPVCLCQPVGFSCDLSYPGNNATFQWLKNGQLVGTSEHYTDSTLQDGDSIVCLMTSSFQFAYPAIARSNVLVVTTKTVNTWTGNEDNNWFNKFNWSCYTVPCEQTDVIIQPGPARMPSIGAGTAHCHSLQLKTGATLQISPGAKLDVLLPQQ